MTNYTRRFHNPYILVVSVTPNMNNLKLELELVWLSRFCKRFRDNALMKQRSETLGHGIFYKVRLSVIRDRTDKIRWSVQSRETRAKKTPDGRGPEQSRVKFMYCKIVKRLTVILPGEYSIQMTWHETIWTALFSIVDNSLRNYP
jgi:hypothetical protein